jgi:predicted permease
MIVEGYVAPANQPELQVDKRAVTPDYFRTMQIPLISGRFFFASDTYKSQPVVLVDQEMAERFWPRGDAVGKRVRQGEHEPWMTIVGVVGVVKEYGLDSETRMVAYFPYAQAPFGTMYLVARTTTDPASMTDAVIDQVQALDPDVPVFDIATMQKRFHDSVARQRFATVMLTAFACFALILAAIGVYGVISFLVSQATPDIAIRMALGAQRSGILSLVLQQGLGLALIGIAAGLVGALMLTRLMASLLFNVSATDPLTFFGTATLLTLVALAACYIPARRAMLVDPMVALRYE